MWPRCTLCRAADDFADEGLRSVETRQDLLDGWLERLRQAGSGREPDSRLRPGEPAHTPAIFLALERKHPGLFIADRLAGGSPQRVPAGRDRDAIRHLDRAARLLPPIGKSDRAARAADCRARDAQLDAWSDAICTALQLANFWQDFKVDYDRGRLYLPLEEQHAHGAGEDDLAAGAILPRLAGGTVFRHGSYPTSL